MSDKNELDAEMERAAAELEKKKAGLPARQAIRARIADYKRKHAALQMELTAIQGDCNHSEETTDLPRRNHDGSRICKDCGRVVVLADLSDF